MRQFVGIARPLASANNKLSIISFNYDFLLERSMKLYWAGSETKYDTLDDLVEFIYPHGKFSDLPNEVHNVSQYLLEQSTKILVGRNRDVAAGARARDTIANSTKIFSIGFSFSDSNVELLGLTPEHAEGLFVQNYNNEDVRLNRKLDQLEHRSKKRDPGDMDKLIRNGFFEQ